MKLFKILFKDSIRTSNKIRLVTITSTNWLVLFKETISANSENHTYITHKYTVGKIQLLSVKDRGT